MRHLPPVHFPLTLALGLLLAGCAQTPPAPPPADQLAVAPNHAGWLPDHATGCWVWDPAPKANEALRWSGACVDGKASGHGIVSWTENGVPTEKDEGDMRAGLLNGQATLSFTDGTRYAGTLHDDHFEGHGVLSTPDGTRYDGDFYNGHFYGHGVLTKADGLRYEGDFYDNRFMGHGVLTLASGDRYDGQFYNGRFNGHGVLTLANGTRRDGYWRNGVPAAGGQ